MSKSAGSFIVLNDVINRGFSPLDYRFLLLGGHYRSQITFSWEAMETAKNGRKNLNVRIAKLLENLPAEQIKELSSLTEHASWERALHLFKDSPVLPYFKDFMAGMEDDLSTPKAVSVLQKLIKDKGIDLKSVLEGVAVMDAVFGLNLIEESAALILRQNTSDVNEEEIVKLVEERAAAKAEKNYRRADEIRDKLKEMGIMLEDQGGKTIWKKM